jgi:hypothetical protein
MARNNKPIINMMPIDIAAFPNLELTNVSRGFGVDVGIGFR